jgi:hypothetical protein
MAINVTKCRYAVVESVPAAANMLTAVIHWLSGDEVRRSNIR